MRNLEYKHPDGAVFYYIGSEQTGYSLTRYSKDLGVVGGNLVTRESFLEPYRKFKFRSSYELTNFADLICTADLIN